MIADGSGVVDVPVFAWLLLDDDDELDFSFDLAFLNHPLRLLFLCFFVPLTLLLPNGASLAVSGE